MTFIALFHDAEHLLATDQLVLTANEVISMDKSIDMTHKLSQHVQGKEELLDAARKEAYDKAYLDGKNAGLKAGREIAAIELTKMVETAHKQRLILQMSVARLAVQVVHKVAGEIGAPKMVAGLAQTAINDLVVGASIKISIHPSVEKTVSSILDPAALLASGRLMHIEIRTDESIDPFDCLLDTDYGQIVANLDDQLKRLEVVLSEGLASEVDGE